MTLEEELRDALRRLVPESAIVFEASTADYFHLIEKRYPLGGSKIDWRHVPVAKDRDVDITAERYFDEALAFTEEVLASERFDREREVLVLDDGNIDPALRMSLSTFIVCMHEILKTFHHTYVIPADGSWVLVYTMEGNLNFGYAPT
jgi:hypothetical protein